MMATSSGVRLFISAGCVIIIFDAVAVALIRDPQYTHFRISTVAPPLDYDQRQSEKHGDVTELCETCNMSRAR